jgi:hypothetical protein
VWTFLIDSRRRSIGVPSRSVGLERCDAINSCYSRSSRIEANVAVMIEHRFRHVTCYRHQCLIGDASFGKFRNAMVPQIVEAEPAGGQPVLSNFAIQCANGIVS